MLSLRQFLHRNSFTPSLVMTSKAIRLVSWQVLHTVPRTLILAHLRLVFMWGSRLCTMYLLCLPAALQFQQDTPPDFSTVSAFVRDSSHVSHFLSFRIKSLFLVLEYIFLLCSLDISCHNPRIRSVPRLPIQIRLMRNICDTIPENQILFSN